MSSGFFDEMSSTSRKIAALILCAVSIAIFSVYDEPVWGAWLPRWLYWIPRHISGSHTVIHYGGMLGALFALILVTFLKLRGFLSDADMSLSGLIIFMQPTRGLDVGAISNIHKQIVAERDRGAAVLLISLELDEVMNLADTIGVIYDGGINRIAKASELTVNEVGEFMMGVETND